MSIIPTRLIDISSNERISGRSSNFSVRLPPIDSRYNRVSLVSASIPKTYYNVQSPYNTFYLMENLSSILVTVPEGNYSFYGLNGFDSMFQNILRTNSFNAISYTVKANTLLGKYEITSSSSSVVTQITFPPSSNLYKNLGCIYNSTIIFDATTFFLSPHVCIFTINTILINSTLVKSVSSLSVAANLLSQINVNSSPSFSSITYINFEPISISRECQVSTEASFIITDSDGTELNLNSIPCDFTLLFFRFDDTNVLIRKNLYFEHANTLLNGQ